MKNKLSVILIVLLFSACAEKNIKNTPPPVSNEAVTLPKPSPNQTDVEEGPIEIQDKPLYASADELEKKYASPSLIDGKKKMEPGPIICLLQKHMHPEQKTGNLDEVLASQIKIFNTLKFAPKNQKNTVILYEDTRPSDTTLKEVSKRARILFPKNPEKLVQKDLSLQQKSHVAIGGVDLLRDLNLFDKNNICYESGSEECDIRSTKDWQKEDEKFNQKHAAELKSLHRPGLNKLTLKSVANLEPHERLQIKMSAEMIEDIEKYHALRERLFESRALQLALKNRGQRVIIVIGKGHEKFCDKLTNPLSQYR